MEAYIVEESVEFDVLHLLPVNHQFGYGHEYLVEFGLHGVLELKSTCATLQLNLLVVGQVDGYGFATGIAFACVIDNVIYVQVALCAWLFLFVFGVAGQLALHLGQHLGEMLQTFRPFFVFY